MIYKQQSRREGKRFAASMIEIVYWYYANTPPEPDKLVLVKLQNENEPCWPAYIDEKGDWYFWDDMPILNDCPDYWAEMPTCNFLLIEKNGVISMKSEPSR